LVSIVKGLNSIQRCWNRHSPRDRTRARGLPTLDVGPERTSVHKVFLHSASISLPTPDSQSVSVEQKKNLLKRDFSGSVAHSSGPQKKASERYPEMTREAWEKFVGPMPIDLFLSEFTPRASTERPANGLAFSHSSVSQNEDGFVRSFAITGVFYTYAYDGQIRAIEESPLCPNIKFINTSRQDG